MTSKIVSNHDPVAEMQRVQRKVAIVGEKGTLPSHNHQQDDGLIVRGVLSEPLVQRAGFGQTLLSMKDRRAEVSNPLASPWRMVCALEITGVDGSCYVGTGWIAGPRLVMTAGHCVYSKDSLGGWAQSIAVSPGRGSDSSAPVYVSTSFKACDHWISREDENHDYGAIILDDDIGDKHGFFSSSSYSDAYLTNRLLNISGYPGSRAGEIQMHHENRVNSLSPTRIYYDIDTEGGQSGSPIWLYEEQGLDPIVVGIHAYGAGKAHIGNSGVRITEEVMGFIRGCTS